MRIVAFSDTHNLHEKVVLPECDIAIFAGDYSGRGNRLETYHFLKWFSSQEQCKYKIMIAGNHDICFDDKFIEETHSHTWLKDLLIKYNNISILEEESLSIKGVNIWGSPVSPWYEGHRWAFNKKRNVINNIWDEIPANTDILITHGPAYKILDRIYDGRNVGCESL